MRKLGMVVIGIVLGTLVGVALAMLFTPKSGDKLRQEAADYYEQLLAEARQAADERRQELELELKNATTVNRTGNSA